MSDKKSGGSLFATKVPEQFVEPFLKAQDYVSQFFGKESRDPTKGEIRIGGQRYVLLSAISLPAIRKEVSKTLGEDTANMIIYNIGKACGIHDAKVYHKAMNVTDPIDKLSAGPIQFSYRGFAFVNLFPECRPSQDENCFLIYDHPNSFELEPLDGIAKPSKPVCHFNAGYSAGFTTESFGIPVESREIMCKATGGKACRFVMAHRDRIMDHLTKEKIQEYMNLR
jgi:son of sevenless-like protein